MLSCHPNLIYTVIYIVFGYFTSLGIKVFNVFINDCIFYTTYGPTSKHLSDENILDIANYLRCVGVCVCVCL